MASMDLANDLYNYERAKVDHRLERAEEIRAAVLTKITQDNMGPLYAHLCEKFGWDVDQTLSESIR